MTKPKVFLTSNVFSADEIGSNEQISKEVRTKIQKRWKELNEIAELKVYDGRFPTKDETRDIIKRFEPDIIGCHLSHPITKNMLKDSDIFAVLTSTAGFNHIERTEEDDIIITHTPGVLHETVADYTIALIMANLRNLIDLHKYVWEGNWTPDDKWDLDQSLSSVINNKVVGIVGLGEIGRELMKRLYLWGLKVIYYDIERAEEIEQLHPGLEFKENLEDLFIESDIVSLHVPLNKHTKHLVDKKYLKLMKKNALLVNTARGGVVNFEELLSLLENREIKIDVAFDVFPEEPIDPEILKRFKKIKKNQPDRRIILMPHNASADADTRGQMDILFLEDMISIINSSKLEDLKFINLIPPHKEELFEKSWKIEQYWKEKND